MRIEPHPVLADADDLVEPDHAARIFLHPPAHAGDERVPARELSHHLAGGLRHGGILRPADDRCERAVHVQEDGSELRLPGEAGDERGALHPWRIGGMQLVLIGIVAGFFSALFGVGGGLVIVPLLLLTGRWIERPAMATSLAAIGIIAVAGSVSYAFHGELKPGAAALVGFPAAVGAIEGTALQ